MARPKRIYKSKKGKYYYLRKGKKIYIKTPKSKKGKTMSQKQVVNIMIKNIVGDSKRRRIKPRSKRKRLKYTKRVAEQQKEVTRRGLPVYLFQPQKIIPSITQTVQNKAKKETDDYKDILRQIKNINENIKIKKTRGIQTSVSTQTKTKPKRKPISELYTYKTFFKFLKNKLRTAEKMKEFIPEILGALKDESLRDTLFKKLFIEYNVSIFNKKKFYELVQILKTVSGDDIYAIIVEFINTEYEEYEKTTPEEKQSLETGDNDPNYEKESPSPPATDAEVREMVGQGDGDGGLYNTEIEKITDKVIDDTTIPVIARNQLNDLDKYIKPNMKRFGFIINTDKIPQKDPEGGHWRAVYINNCDDYQSIEIFDPLVSTPEKGLIQKLRDISKKINPEEYFKFKNNNLQSQPDDSPHCGYHCILFLEKRFHGIPWSEASYYDEYMKKNKPHYDGEKEVLKKIKKYSSYI